MTMCRRTMPCPPSPSLRPTSAKGMWTGLLLSLAFVAEPANAAEGASGNQDRVPSVDVICKAAVDLAMVNPERAQSFVSRARLAGWLPETTVRIYRRFARTEGINFEDPVTGAAVPVEIKAIDDVRYEWRASWDLSRMVFNPDEIPAHYEALRMADVRRDIQLLVIRLYFERRRLLSERTESGVNPPTGAAPLTERHEVRILEIEAQLDALSGGLLSGARNPRPPAEAPPS